MQVEEQTSGTVLMVRPASFGFHAEAAESNAFATGSADAGVRAHAIRESDRLARALDEAGVEVLMLEDRPDPDKPDAVFPNNWVSFHGDGTMVLYPMATERRRLERNSLAVSEMLRGAGFVLSRTIDLSHHEQQGGFLEGTGSLILDRPNRRAFASRSIRTHPAAVADWDAQTGFSTFLFDAVDAAGNAIYHTNVLLSLGSGFAVLCSEAVPEEQREPLSRELRANGRELIEVDYDQMRQFACNILELKGRTGPVIAMSSAALRSFRPHQLRQLQRFGEIAHADVRTIEGVGGGSVRCMIADVHLPRRPSPAT